MDQRHVELETEGDAVKKIVEEHHCVDPTNMVECKTFSDRHYLRLVRGAFMEMPPAIEVKFCPFCGKENPDY